MKQVDPLQDAQPSGKTEEKLPQISGTVDIQCCFWDKRRQHNLIPQCNNQSEINEVQSLLEPVASLQWPDNAG